MHRLDLLYFLNLRHRIVVSDCLYFWRFVSENGQNFGFLFGRETKLL